MFGCHDSNREPRRRAAARVAVLLLLAVARLRADEPDGLVLLYHGPERFLNEATHLNTMKYKDKAVLQEGLSGWDILRDIERRGRDGAKIAEVQILGHGLPSGPQTTGAEGMKKSDDRLTLDKITSWAAELRKAGIEPRSFFAPGATITIRACYVGAGEIPKALLDVLPPDGKVVSDYGYYINSAASNLFGGTWSRQRVTTKDSDIIYKKGSSGASVTWENRREEGGKGDFAGSWTGEAEVTTVSMTDGKAADVEQKRTQAINPGAFVIRKLEGGDLELNYMGNLLKGTPGGETCIFAPDGEKGGNIQAADLTIKEDTMTGSILARNKEIMLVRKLTLTRVK